MPPGYQVSDIGSQFVIALMMVRVSAVVMSVPVMASAVLVTIPSTISVFVPSAIMLNVTTTAAVPKTAGTGDKQGNGQY
jgi:hypothetical protein